MQQYPSSPWVEFAKAFVRETSRRATKERFVAWTQAMIDILSQYEPDSYDGDVLIMTSEDDELSYNALEAHEKRYPSADVYIFGDGAHHTLFVRPERYTQVVQNFLDSKPLDEEAVPVDQQAD